MAPAAGLAVALVLIVLAFALPALTGWQTWPRAPRSATDLAVPPLHGYWQPKLLGPGTVPALLLAVLGWRRLPAWACTWSWARLLVAAYGAGLAWLLSLALVDGTSGISRVLGGDSEYLDSARAVDDVPAMLDEYVSRIPYSAAPDNWPTHPAGHPPGALLVFVALDRVRLGGDLAAGLVVTVVAASTAVAVLVCLRALDAEHLARKAAPFLVLTPAAVFMAVSADALFAAVAAWGLACLALGARAAAGRLRPRAVGWSVLAGLLLGYTVMMSYGLPLLGLVALAVLVVARAWLPLPVAAVTAASVVLAFAALGFSWWEAFPVLRARYWDGIARDRPMSYWWWANLAALLVSGGPLLGASVAVAATRARDAAARPVVLLAGAAAACIVLADASQMSKAEVERIWLPFVPWLTLSCALLPARWRRAGLALQLFAALVVQHLLYTSW